MILRDRGGDSSAGDPEPHDWEIVDNLVPMIEEIIANVAVAGLQERLTAQSSRLGTFASPWRNRSSWRACPSRTESWVGHGGILTSRADAVEAYDTATNAVDASVSTGSLTLDCKLNGHAAVGTLVVFSPNHSGGFESLTRRSTRSIPACPRAP